VLKTAILLWLIKFNHKELTLTYRFGFDYTDYDRKVGYPQINLDDALINDDKGYSDFLAG
jgi:protein-S-isoprenylcysteine O-methyltransferase Ste14